MYEIKSFDSSSRLLEDFKKFPQMLYKKDPFYIPKPESYPVNTEFFLVYKDSEIAGRIATIINPEIEYKNYNVGLLGFYECIEDEDVSALLFEAAKESLKNKGIDFIIGPMNGSSWQNYRVTLNSSTAPFFLDNYNKPWYEQQFSENDFSIIANYTSTKTTKLNKDYKRIDKFKKIFSQKGINIRSIDLNNFENELKKIYEISIKSFKNNFLYTPISYEEFVQMYLKIKNFTNPDFVLIAESINIPLGFIFAIDNIFEKEKKSLIAKSLAVIPDKNVKGIGSLLTEIIHKTANEQGYDEVIHALMHEENISANILANNSEMIRQYVLFGRKI